MTALDDLLQQLQLERIEENLFRGQSKDLGWGTVFGGQVLGQAVSAASQTVSGDRLIHSLHAYFLRPGNVSLPIVYEVDRIRDGQSFATRRIVAIQAGRPIFNMSASFQVEEQSFEHSDGMPKVPEPESLPSEIDRWRVQIHQLPEFLRERALVKRAFDIRSTDPLPTPEEDLFAPPARPPERCLWIKAVTAMPDDPTVHRSLLAYASDYGFLGSALLPHSISWLSPHLQIASIDHVMWFHEPFRVDEWLLHVMESPKAKGARGLVRGRIFTRDGRLVVSTAQEGLLRKR